MFDSTEEATMECTAAGGYPPIHNISIMKNGQVIVNQVSHEITYTTGSGLPRNVYGYYTCIVNNTAGASSRHILLQNKGTLNNYYKQCGYCNKVYGDHSLLFHLPSSIRFVD